MVGLREQKKLDTRSQIVDAATAAFLARGFDAVTVEEIAVEVGISARTLFRYFPTKEDLVFDDARRRLDGILRDLDKAPDGRDALSVLFTTIVRVATDDAIGLSAPSMAAMIDSSRSLHGPALQLQRDVRDALIGWLARYSGRDETDVALRLAVSTAMAAMTTAVETWEPASGTSLADHMTSVLDRLRRGLAL